MDAEQQMNINSTISHYQGGIIMMNAILHRVRLQGREKKQKAGNVTYQEMLKVEKLVQETKESKGGEKLLSIPDLNTRSDIKITFIAELWAVL